MKTNPSARRLVRVRVVSLWLAIAAIAGLGFSLSESLASRVGETTARQNASAPAPNVSLSDLMAAGR